MSADLRDLYQEVVLDHGRHPRNFRPMEGASAQSVGFNPLCGDKLTLFLRFEGDVVVDASFQGSGCAISTASASILTEVVKGKTRPEVEALLADFLDMLGPCLSIELHPLPHPHLFSSVLHPAPQNTSRVEHHRIALFDLPVAVP